MFAVLCVILKDINKYTDHPVKLRKGFETSYCSQASESLMIIPEEEKNIDRKGKKIHGNNIG